MIIASFWVYRPEQFPFAADYPAMLRILQRSCDRLGLHHVCLTDQTTAQLRLWPAGVEAWAMPQLPVPLMNACTEIQARFLESFYMEKEDVLFVGADCIMIKPPRYPATPDLCVTYRKADSKYPINTGAVLARSRNREKVAAFFRGVANACGPVWCDDQRAMRAALEPMPKAHGIFERAGLKVGFMTMTPYNVLPRSAEDPASHAFMVHFRGKARKQLLFEWAARHGYAAPAESTRAMGYSA